MTIGCQIRGANQLCQADLAPKLLEAARFYHARGHWFLRLFLLMPDHVHALVAPAPDKSLNRVVSD
ncbi:MAG TPA: hypothetical protein VL069_11995, partial [Opitutus sp.]|nr:hypothetical protein [Opitutus sp.]